MTLPAARVRGEPLPAEPASDDRLPRALALASAAVVGGSFVVPGRWFAVTGVLVLALGGTVAFRRSRDAAALALSSAALIATFWIPAVAHLTPAPILLALAILLAASRFPVPWLVRGEFGAAVASWVATIAVAAGVALVAWWVIARPDVSDLTLTSELRGAVAHPVVLVAAILGWSALNAIAEELLFRGALQHALSASLGQAPGIAAQAVAFGLFHFRGFPRGWSSCL